MEEVLNYISTYGLAIVISGFVLYFAIKVGNITIENWKSNSTAKKHDELSLLRNQVSSTIQTILERTVLRTRACRVYVFEFHNGNISMGGLPFLKMTNTYEALGEGAKSEARRRENMSLQLYSSFVDAVSTKSYLVMDVDNRTDDFSQLVYETLVEREIRITVRTKIVDVNKKIIGYFGIDYCNHCSFDDETIQESIEIIQDLSAEIGALLSVNNKRKEQSNLII